MAIAKAIVLYNRPANTEAFDRHFNQVHGAIVRRFPGLRAFTVNASAVISPTGASPYYTVVEMVFDSLAELEAAVLRSPEGQAAADDLANFAQAGVTLIYFEAREA